MSIRKYSLFPAAPLTRLLVDGSPLERRRRHASTILRYAPETENRIWFILPDREDLWDPYGGTEEEYGRVAELTWLAVAGIAERLLAEEGE